MKEKMNKIPVFYACDDNFVKYTMVSLQSMMDHASKEAQYEIHVLHTNISEEMQKKMHAMENANFSVQFDHVNIYIPYRRNFHFGIIIPKQHIFACLSRKCFRK